VAVTGHVSAEPLLLVLIIFAWTPPHFWALAIHRKEEYAKADIPMLPVTHGEHYTKVHILLYTFALLAVSLLPYVIHMSGVLYLICALGLGALSAMGRGAVPWHSAARGDQHLQVLYLLLVPAVHRPAR
jgi:protoheme IX farnesyltransferase